MSRMIDINPDNLTQELKQRGLKHREASVQLGHGSSYISDALRRKKISIPTTKMLQNLFNIAPESYVLKETKDEETPDEVPETDFDYQKLGEVIYSAVYQAVKKAWSE